MATRAKFNCFSVTDFGSGQQAKLQAVTNDGDAENESFWNATPSGTLDISISNPAVRDFFKPGKAYYLDITPAA